MSLDIDVIFDDWDDATEKLILLEVKLEKDFTLDEKIEIAGLVLENAKEIVPVRTGDLKNSLQIRVVEDSVFIGSDLDYSVYVELGTSRFLAKPYLIPSLLLALQIWSERFPGRIKEIMQV